MLILGVVFVSACSQNDEQTIEPDEVSPPPIVEEPTADDVEEDVVDESRPLNNDFEEYDSPDEDTMSTDETSSGNGNIEFDIFYTMQTLNLVNHNLSASSFLTPVSIGNDGAGTTTTVSAIRDFAFTQYDNLWGGGMQDAEGIELFYFLFWATDFFGAVDILSMQINEFIDAVFDADTDMVVSPILANREQTIAAAATRTEQLGGISTVFLAQAVPNEADHQVETNVVFLAIRTYDVLATEDDVAILLELFTHLEFDITLFEDILY